MARAWNHTTHIEDLFEQHLFGKKIATEGGDAPLDPQLVRLGYNIIH